MGAAALSGGAAAAATPSPRTKRKTRLLAEPLKVVVSTPEISYCPGNPPLHEANVMEYIVHKSEQYPDLIKMGFDFAGSKTTNPKDAPIWDELFGDIELEMPGLIQAWKTVARKPPSAISSS